MDQMERCPACRARLADAPVCSRCGTDFSISRRAERQALGWACIAVRQLSQGQTRQAAEAAEAASHLANSPLAHAVTRMIRRRETTPDQIVGNRVNRPKFRPLAGNRVSRL